MTQCDKILAHLREHGEICDAVARTRYGVTRLAARIIDLRSRGHNITSEMVAGKNRFQETVHYSVYRLQEGQ